MIRGTHRAKDDRNGFALAAQSGQSLGRPSNNTTSQVTAYNGLPWLIPPEHPEPDHQIIELDPAPTRSPRDVIPDNNRIERDHEPSLEMVLRAVEEELAEAKRYGRLDLVCTLLDKAIDLVFMAGMALVLARPIDAWLGRSARFCWGLGWRFHGRLRVVG